MPKWAKARLLLTIALCLVFIFFFFLWRLGTMTSGLGPREYKTSQNSQGVEQIITQGINAPYHLAQNGFLRLLNNDLLGLRLASVLAALVMFIFLFLILRSWFGRTTALFAGIIFVSTPWVIVSARTATADIMLLLPLVLLALFTLMSRSKQHAWQWWLLLCVAAGLALYTPGLVWFVLAGSLVAGRAFLNLASRVSTVNLVVGVSITILLAFPLALAVALEPVRIKELFLIPNDWQPGLATLKSVGWSAASLFWQTRDPVDIGVNRLPVLNILQIVLVIFGVYALFARARRVIYTLIGLLTFSVLAAGINQDLHLLILGLPAIAIMTAAGLRYLYIEWRRVFPLNPFAYGLAISLISLVVGVHMLYGARYSLIAWPQTTETRNAYVLK